MQTHAPLCSLQLLPVAPQMERDWAELGHLIPSKKQKYSLNAAQAHTATPQPILICLLAAAQLGHTHTRKGAAAHMDATDGMQPIQRQERIKQSIDAIIPPQV